MQGNQENLELNQIQVSLAEFLRTYNKNIPTGFPRVTTTALKKFQTTHPALFKRNNMWSIDQHRKKVIDWFPSHRNES
ncbi:MAG: hypothetical protein A3F94_02520 [Candidatus Spechtbacteria bacterium RIFCSPLOWO2_12_FULL_38_22]|uniref:Uncharacterized protein n=1 Tax=Candidatus Spechtbacteria bacterium RIFCSPLOWO2_12_FULL_38_22 TaxID=1802165 RepID=A0A1G2HHV8_9BACT|nr:MAG: hypothetical protein A2728_01095 [Candidatus Spechtbacteria bacterium RIFCSPHIGHO2_01_FULL_38_11]OGZ59453.1 MAG: hypothetical protein A3E58_00730 [Candidatus Spechtbacteria bacterium RIFCSPHIGHO2_12_FULL_38_30]OGZ61138.1 MAG: hypothetical protein A3A00_01030 [Candidatus Spechtbacteria bacterium RIFCSPLOWO2_01_FULL_38_20]OGZ62082.1 MAG: hypothetical protein A3F94_02520 [Candidatus Spechtbacteria bacterium RIFCSPLOWO2_12_FULL_38_22]